MKKSTILKTSCLVLFLLTLPSYAASGHTLQEKLVGLHLHQERQLASAVLEASDFGLAVSFISGKLGPVSLSDPAYLFYRNDSGDYDPGSDNREFAYAPQTLTDEINTLLVARKVYVPANEALCRWLNIFTNTGHSAVTFNVIISSNRGSDHGAIITTADGDSAVEATDAWMATMPAFYGGLSASYFNFILQNANAPVPVSAIQIFAGNTNWTYTVTLQPGQTGIIMNLTAGQHADEAPGANALQLVQNPVPALKYMSRSEICQLLNFCPPYEVEVKSNGHGHTDQDGWHFFPPGTEFTVKAFPDPGYSFHKWTGSVCCFDNPLWVLVNSHMTICANFKNDPPKVTITNPAKGATVKGTVNIETTATDDSGITKVDFQIDGITKATLTTPPYQYSWNTVPYAYGKCAIKAVAYDTLGLSGSDDIFVFIQNVTLTISASRVTEKTWLCPKKQVGNLEIRIDNPYNAPIAKLVIQRKVNGDKFQTVKEVTASEIKGNVYLYRDGTVEKDKTYVYKATVYDTSGKILGVSNEKCI